MRTKEEILSSKLNTGLLFSDGIIDKIYQAMELYASEIQNSGRISVEDKYPEIEDYYLVRYENGQEDEKPFRNRPNKNIYGFMTERKVTYWKN